CGISVRATSEKNDAELGDVPVTVSVAVTGEVAGEPEYASPPKKPAGAAATKNGDSSDDGGPAIGSLIVLGLGAVVLIGLLLASLSRRRRTA
ncbi:MAG: hypothetical protein ABWX74_14830, partial [Aeromicrobium sp.]